MLVGKFILRCQLSSFGQKEKPQMPRPNYTVFEDKNQLSQYAAQLFVFGVASAKSHNQLYRVALAGGSTPAMLYRLLTDSPFREQIDWEYVQLFFGDERCVPPDSLDSNFRMVEESLLTNLEMKPEVFRMDGELDPEEAATRYEETLRKEFGIKESEIPRFDLILLGMGSDGHTASLFPHKDSLKETARFVVVAEPGLEPFVPRLTLTLPVLNNAVEVLFLVAGEDKAATVKRVFDGKVLPKELPSQTVKPTQGTLTWLLDKAAASLLL